jgi:hypothetical protein
MGDTLFSLLNCSAMTGPKTGRPVASSSFYQAPAGSLCPPLLLRGPNNRVDTLTVGSGVLERCQAAPAEPPPYSMTHCRPRADAHQSPHRAQTTGRAQAIHTNTEHARMHMAGALLLQQGASGTSAAPQGVAQTSRSPLAHSPQHTAAVNSQTATTCRAAALQHLLAAAAEQGRGAPHTGTVKPHTYSHQRY